MLFRSEKVQQTTTPELKQLPEHLHYAFLGDNYTFLVIVAASLTPGRRGKVAACVEGA